MLTYLFLSALLLNIATKLWLASRQIHHVSQHRQCVPPQFADTITLPNHQLAADYTVARARLAMIEILIHAVLLVTLTMLGGLQWLNLLLQHALGTGYVYSLALVTSVITLSGLIDLPLSWYSQFVIEQRFGFNKMTQTLFFMDLLKSTLIGALLGLPLLLAMLWLMTQMGSTWWLWAWLLWMGFNLLLLVLYPTVIAPLFNKFEPLKDDVLKARIESLLRKCGFASKGLFVMDGSRRSSHGNAYFTGFGSAKRIVFFDTLIQRLNGEEIEAVLAHELGHFKHRHVLKRLVLTFLLSLGVLWLLGWLSTKVWFYTSLGVLPNFSGGNQALALLLFFLVLPVFSFFLGPFSSLSSRRHEFEADAFAAQQTHAQDLISALVKLYQDNASTLTPDPIYSAFYYSHPPATQRIARLATLA